MFDSRLDRMPYRRRHPVRVLAAATALACAAGSTTTGCERGDDPATPAATAVETRVASAPPEPPAAPPEPSDAAPERAILLTPNESLPPPPSPEAPRVIPPDAAEAAIARPASPPAAPQPPPPSHPPLDILLQAPRETEPAARPLDLGTGASAPAGSSAAAAPDAIDRWKSHVRLERRSDLLGPAGPRQGTLSETEAALRIPVDEDVSLEGGVRVDQRDEPGTKAPERRSTPRVGVEVRF